MIIFCAQCSGRIHFVARQAGHGVWHSPTLGATCCSKTCKDVLEQKYYQELLGEVKQ